MEVLIMVGPPGSGKSTYVKKLRESGKVVFDASADDYFVKDGEYNFDHTKLGEAHLSCYKTFIYLVRDCGYLTPDYVVVDNTNLNFHDITPYTMFAQALGIPFKIVKFDVDPEVAAARNVHGVPKEKVLKMAERLKHLHLPKHWPVEVVSND